ncbi:MAG: methyltransferase [Proteobacteria bacterium]|nr:methyltransferase [Pseudomonadota bacterium]MBU1059263.1 methyltransferase [Pseudomonadota bacterium]
MADLEQTNDPLERSRDTLFDGSLHCLQYKAGYRFSLDAVLLAHFVCPGKDETILDLGAGCGVVGLILLHRAAERIRSLLSFELQPELAQLARENIRLNQFEKKMEVVEGDLCHILAYCPPESFSTVVCNPPFYTVGSGRPSGNDQALIARHQVACTLPEILAAAAAVVKNKGRLVMIYPAEKMGILLGLLPQQRLAVKRMQLVYSYPEPPTNARLLLLEVVKNGGEGGDILPPFYIYNHKDGEYSPAMQRQYEADWSYS